MNLITKAALFMIVFAMALIAGLQTYTFVHFAQEPFVVVAAIATNSPVSYGEDLHIRYTAERRVLCRTEADIFILQVPEEIVAESSRRPAGVIPLGTSTWSARISTIGLKPGKFAARIFVNSDCGDRLHTIMVPDIPFEVAE